jgi:hypothetical protein
MAAIPTMINRGLEAGLVGAKGIIWSVADNGWIFEARLTNIEQAEYHGYPVRPSEAIAERVYRRFVAWSQRNGSEIDRMAAANCKARYRFRG